MVCSSQPLYLKRKRVTAVILSVYGDESADAQERRVFAVAGIVGTDDRWDELEKKWTYRTGSVPFHANNCDSDLGDYSSSKTGLDEDTNHHNNKVLYADLSNLLANSGLYGWGVAIDLLAANRILPEVRILPYYKGFIDVVAAMKQLTREYPEATLRFTFDSRIESEHNAGILYGMLRETPENERLSPEVSFACSRKQARVQAADLLAREVMKCLDNVIGPSKRPPRKSWIALKQTKRFACRSVEDTEFLRVRIQMEELEKKHSTTKEYRDWIERNNLQENVTNLFRFVHFVLPKYR